MYEVITTFKKLISTFLLKQSFACQIEMTHISFVNLHFTGMISINLPSYIKNDLNCAEVPQRFNFNAEITIIVLSDPIPNVHVFGIYRSKTYVTLSDLIDALNHLHSSKLTDCRLQNSFQDCYFLCNEHISSQEFQHSPSI